MPTYNVLIINGIIMIGLTVCLFCALRLFMRINAKLPPMGARRVQFRLGLDDRMPVDELPASLQSLVATHDAIFLFVDPACACDFVVRAVPNLARSYKELHFVLCSMGAIKEEEVRGVQRVHVLANSSFTKSLGIHFWPYAIKTSQARVVEFGVINSVEHIESVIAA